MKHLIVTSEFNLKTIFRTQDITNISINSNGDFEIYFINKTKAIFNKNCMITFENLTKYDKWYRQVTKKNK